MKDRFSNEYFAGLFDGEGSITIRQDKRRTAPDMCIRLGNLNTEVLRKLPEAYGGTIQFNQYTSMRKGYYTWVQWGENAVETLRGWLPSLVIKRPQALLAVEFQYRRKPALAGKDSAQLEELASYRTRMLELNGRKR